DKLNHLFIQITDDLSYSRTFYPNRSVRVYLNNLAQQIFYSIYKNKKTRAGRLMAFWTDELPQLVYTARIEFRLAFLIFFLCFGIGMLSSAMDPDFPAVMLGDAYVEMTVENIESGDPMAVYKQGGQFSSTLGITANNLFVAMLTFIMGVFFAVGTVAILINNAIMIGAFQYFFYEKGVLLDSLLAVWLHGTLEISAIIIAGAAGLTMGRGLIFPGTLSRLQAFQISARRGLKIMIGIVPLILTAGFIEGYFTRYTDAPNILRALFILASLLFVLVYFVWYPVYKARRGFQKTIRDTELPPNSNFKIDFTRIKTSGEIFAEIFILYRNHFKSLLLASLLAGLLYCGWAFGLGLEDVSTIFYYSSVMFSSSENIDQFFVNDSVPLLPILNMLVFSIVTWATYNIVRKEATAAGMEGNETPLGILSFFTTLLAVAVFQLIMMTNDWYTVFLFFFGVPIVLTWGYVMYWEKNALPSSMVRTFQLLGVRYGSFIGLFFLLLSVGFLFYTFMDTTLLWFYFELIGWNLSLEQEALDKVGAVVLTFVSITVICLVYNMLVLGLCLFYYSLREIKEANSLFARIPTIGGGKRIQGMEKES
ncbi:MAG: stage II sporulation protein M, partial [Bacteroidota bacterium]